MEALLAYLKTMPMDERKAFAKRCGTSWNYLNKAICIRQKLRDGVVIAIERESGGKVKCEQMRPDVDWAYLRGTAVRRERKRTAA